jgi:hypothetical protein
MINCLSEARGSVGAQGYLLGSIARHYRMTSVGDTLRRRNPENKKSHNMRIFTILSNLKPMFGCISTVRQIEKVFAVKSRCLSSNNAPLKLHPQNSPHYGGSNLKRE